MEEWRAGVKSRRTRAACVRMLVRRFVNFPQPVIPLFKLIGSPETLSRDSHAPLESIVLTWRNIRVRVSLKPIESPKALSRDSRAPPESIVLTWRNTTGDYQPDCKADECEGEDGKCTVGSQKDCDCKICPEGIDAVSARNFLKRRKFLIEISSLYVPMRNVMEVKVGSVKR